jgi:hypothetical protein
MNFTLLEDYEDVEIQVTTSNPERKYKKKLRKFKTQYEKNPSRELSVKISEVEKMLRDLNKPKTVVEKKVRTKVKKVRTKVKKVRKENNSSDVLIKQWMVNRPHKKFDEINSNRIKNDFELRKQKINDKYLPKLYKLCENDINHSILRETRGYFRNPNKEWLYNKLMSKYGTVGLKNIQKTIYKLFHNLPVDIIKIIWKFYFETNYFKVGIMIENFKKEIDNEKEIFNTRQNLYK